MYKLNKQGEATAKNSATVAAEVVAVKKDLKTSDQTRAGETAEVKQKLDDTHKLINSRMDELLAAASAAGFARGAESEKNKTTRPEN